VQPWVKNRIYDKSPEGAALKRMTFEDEFREICKRHGIEIDERYDWDWRINPSANWRELGPPLRGYWLTWEADPGLRRCSQARSRFTLG